MGCHQLSVWAARLDPLLRRAAHGATSGCPMPMPVPNPPMPPSSGPPVQATPTRPTGQFCASKSDHQWFSAASRSYLVLKEDQHRVKTLATEGAVFGGIWNRRKQPLIGNGQLCTLLDYTSLSSTPGNVNEEFQSTHWTGAVKNSDQAFSLIISLISENLSLGTKSNLSTRRS